MRQLFRTRLFLIEAFKSRKKKKGPGNSDKTNPEPTPDPDLIGDTPKDGKEDKSKEVPPPPEKQERPESPMYRYPAKKAQSKAAREKARERNSIERLRRLQTLAIELDPNAAVDTTVIRRLPLSR